MPSDRGACRSWEEPEAGWKGTLLWAGLILCLAFPAKKLGLGLSTLVCASVFPSVRCCKNLCVLERRNGVDMQGALSQVLPSLLGPNPQGLTVPSHFLPSQA